MPAPPYIRALLSQMGTAQDAKANHADREAAKSEIKRIIAEDIPAHEAARKREAKAAEVHEPQEYEDIPTGHLYPPERPKAAPSPYDPEALAEQRDLQDHPNVTGWPQGAVEESRPF